MTFETLTMEKNGRLATLTLNRPQSMNAMNGTMMKEIAEALEELHEDKELQVLLIKGEGRAFSAGGDIKAMMDPTNPLDIDTVMVDVSRLAKALYTLPMITIASVHGAAAGLGFSLVLGCDVVVAEENSKLAMNFIGIGLVPDGAGHFFLKETWNFESDDEAKAKGQDMIDEKDFTNKTHRLVNTAGKLILFHS